MSLRIDQISAARRSPPLVQLVSSFKTRKPFENWQLPEVGRPAPGFAEAVRGPPLFARVRRTLDGEIGALQRRAGPNATPHDAGALPAFVLGSLVLGAFAPRKTAGFAAPGFRCLAEALVEAGCKVGA